MDNLAIEGGYNSQEGFMFYLALMGMSIVIMAIIAEFFLYLMPTKK